MAAAGARGTTARQLDHALGATGTAAAVSDADALRRAISASVRPGAKAPTLAVANALWTQRGLPLAPAFVATLRGDFGAPPQPASFATAPQAARHAINAWVSRHTAGIIPDVLPPGSVSTSTRFVLANAVYLKAVWATQFNPAATRPATFTTATGRRVRVPFMSASDVSYPYTAAAGLEAVELPYRSSSLSLLAILPVGRSLTSLERTLSVASLTRLTDSLRPQAVDLRIPKLDLSTQVPLNAPLQALGVTAAFGPSADFRGITPAEPLQIALVEHAADLRVDERGTVAAGATVIVGPTAVALPPARTVSVDLDRPFLLLLRDDRSGTILFVAQVADPQAS